MQYLNGFIAENVPGGSDGCNMSGVVVDLEHDGAVELPGRILAELQLDQALGVQWLPSAGIHFVLLDEGQDIQQVKHMTLKTKKEQLKWIFTSINLTSSSQYGLAKGCRLREQWSKGSRLKSTSSGSVDLPGFFPPKKYFHSCVVRYNLSD